MVEWVTNWIEHLTYCPSQLKRAAKVRGTVLWLYLRWRWEDPWQFYVYIESPRPVFITGDLFQERGVFITAEEYKRAEQEAERIFLELAPELAQRALLYRAQQQQV